MTPQFEIKPRCSLGWLLLTAAIAVLTVFFIASAPSPGADLQQQLDRKKAAIADAGKKKKLLTTEITRFNDKITQLTGEVAALRTREAAVRSELEQAQKQLDIEQKALQVLRIRLRRSIDAMEARLVGIYKADGPDVISVILDSNGYDDVLSRYQYLQAIQEQGAGIVDRVRSLRDDTRATVARVKATRDSIAAKQDELVRTRLALQEREAQLSAARSKSKQRYALVKDRARRLESVAGRIEGKIQQQLAAATAASGTPTLPAGPIQSGSGSMIWPVNGTLTSPFGERWGRLHAGIDIAAPGGAPIRAAEAGTVVLMQSEAESGGYGNYTCIDHGGGLSTCYAHQSGFATSMGAEVAQGDVIGYVGNTGESFGDHLHFETRVNGTPTDPMGFL